MASLIIRPPRARYNLTALLDKVTGKNGVLIDRTNVVFQNHRNQKIYGSFFKPSCFAPGNPCVIYLHGNASSQHEGMFLPQIVTEFGISVFVLDLSGSGMSEGEYISLGYHERDDVECAISHLRENYEVQNIVLWGRSMGATIAAWCAANPDLRLSGIICDSPYISVDHIISDMKSKSYLIGALLTILKFFVNRTVKKSIGISIKDINILPDIEKAKVPALFVHTFSDSMIDIQQSLEIFAHYGSYRKLLYTPSGDHMSNRHEYCMELQFSCLFDFFDLDVQIEDKNDVNANVVGHFADALAMLSKIYQEY